MFKALGGRSAALALSLGVLVGCSSGGGGAGCLGSTLAPLPKSPAPTGFPFDQEIEGGMQVRITKPGFDKLTSMIPGLVGKSLAMGQCAVQPKSYGLLGGSVGFCATNSCPGGSPGCPLYMYLNSGDRPPPHNHDDGKDRILTSIADGPNPTLTIDATFDVDVPVEISYKFPFGLGGGSCTMQVYDKHVVDDSQDPLHIIGQIQFGIDAQTGELTIKLASLNLPPGWANSLGVSNGCGSIIQTAVDWFIGILNSSIGNLLTNLIVKALTPQLNNLIAGFLPKPPGLAGVLSTGKMLANLNAPPESALEMWLVAGGYVSALRGGINLGVLTGMNSDNDPTTRGPGMTTEPNLCVPNRGTPALGGAPWNLPTNPDRPDFSLLPADQFSGNPDPVDTMGNTQDLALGLSRGFLNLAGFHIFNSGSMCLSFSGGSIPMLNSGALSVLIPSLANLVEDRKAPLALSVRPETPLVFSIGSGAMDDPLINVGINDLRIDFYAFIEERYVRIFTLAADMNVGINLTLTSDSKGNPAIQPMITGIDKKSIQLRVTNTDLLQEDPKKLAKLIGGLIDIAVGQLMGGLKPFSLPSLQGFSLDGLTIQRVQTTQDDFIAIFSSLVHDPNGTMAPVPDWVPSRREAHAVDTTARLLDVSVPPADVIRTGVLANDATSQPSVTLALGSTVGDPEWSVRVDGGSWHAWSSDPRPTIQDAAFLLQAHHAVEVRARAKNDWLSEDPTPALLDVIIDSVAPTMKPQVEEKAGAQRLVLHALDNVTDDDKLRFSYVGADGHDVDLGNRSWLSEDEVLAATADGTQSLALAALDEVGNRGLVTVDTGTFGAFHGRKTSASSGGCGGCSLRGGARAEESLATLGLVLVGLGLGLRRRGRSSSERA